MLKIDTMYKEFGHIELVYDEGSSREDSYLIGDGIFGVFDGYPDFKKLVYKDGRTGGIVASSLVKEVFASSNNKDLADIAVEANNKLSDRALGEHVDLTDKMSLCGTTAAVVRFNGESLDWLQIGDSLILIINIDGSFRLLFEGYDLDKEVLLIWKQSADKKEKDIMPIMLGGPLIELRKKANVEYGTLNGEEGMRSFIQSGKLDLSGVSDILIFTDGIFLPKEDPARDDDWTKFVGLYQKSGLIGVVGYVRQLEREDPCCWKYPRYKQFDDITAISISRKKRY